MARSKVTTLKEIRTFKARFEKAKKIAEAHSKKTRTDDRRFLGSVFLAHQDGSIFLFDSAYAMTWDPDNWPIPSNGFAIVITEHHGNRVYPMDEVKTLRAYGPRDHIERCKP